MDRDWTKHEDGDCPPCWIGYPVTHEGCGGAIHAEYGEDYGEDEYFLLYHCDRCGSDDRPRPVALPAV